MYIYLKYTYTHTNRQAPSTNLASEVSPGSECSPSPSKSSVKGSPAPGGSQSKHMPAEGAAGGSILKKSYKKSKQKETYKYS
jgi:hypothetical protein